MISVAEALARVLASAPKPVTEESVSIEAALGRTLASDLHALRTQPPFANSAMDGYALRAADTAPSLARLRVIGESAAGRAFTGAVGAHEAVRIFTGAPMPQGADAVLIQENAAREGDLLVAKTRETSRHNVRDAGIDFVEGELLLPAGRRLSPRDLALAAAANHPTLAVRRRPRVAILATGDELVRPGDALGPSQIVASNNYAIAGIVAACGGESVDLGIAADEMGALARSFRRAQEIEADILVTLGGASVGDYDLVQRALVDAGLELGFWRIAMRPGKPLMQGRLGAMRVLGLPGNPVSSVVCAILFLAPLLRALAGDPQAGADVSEPAALGADVAANDMRQDYLRATLARDAGGALVATPFTSQDSSLVKLLARAQCLVVRPPHAPATRRGEACRIIRLDEWGL
ncbi:gephyrin-like molybdotransferase Glp [Methylocapsa sp. S129]|uniref:molybdopterin molybdotransferase MoeA n=1 Tax=Methylocapsa sp. S129 TaxID=1641869 RepID=UPI00131C9AD3|nr:gephyrin-like molybdotransferase Glp [Methylocapsa sp. S129]